mgnify:CR=1 FL=1
MRESSLRSSVLMRCGTPLMIEAAQRDFVAQCKLPEEEFFADSFTSEADLAAA